MLAGIPLKVSNSAHPDRQLCLCFRLMLVGGKRLPKRGETGPVEDDAECSSWTAFLKEKRGKAAPATVKTLPRDWRFVLADEYFERLGITAAEAWILVAFLLAGPSATRATPDRVKRLLPANKWKATCELCRNPTRAGGGHLKCFFPGCDDTNGRAMGNLKGYPFCGSKKKGCIKRALDYEAVHGKKPEGVSWAEFYRPST